MTNKLVIATTLYGTPQTASVTWGYHEAILSICRQQGVEILHPSFGISSDLVRARSRAVRIFLETDGTHLLFWDEDTIPRSAGEMIGIMMGSGLDFIACPYPRKKIRWDALERAVRDEDEQARLGRQTAIELEAETTDWPMRTTSPDPAMILTDNGSGKRWPVYEANECAMGFTMISRRALERMVDVYSKLRWIERVWVLDETGEEFSERNEAEDKEGFAPPGHWEDREASLNFFDHDGDKKPATVALFQLMIREGVLCSEDYSFCYRWKDIGGKMWMLGDHCAHVGAHVFGSFSAPK